MPYTIRKVTTMQEIHGIVEIQRQAWNMNDLGIVPTFEMKAVSSVGTVLVAVNDEDIPIGFIYAYDQIPDSHYSHMMAILPEYQGQSIGYALKKEHRRIALEKGIKHIRWTVDPLLPNNAFLNFAKLGGICNIYYSNYYGPPDVEGIGLYAGLDTDRFLIDWVISDERVERRMNDYQSDRVDKESLLKRAPAINVIEDDLPVNQNIDINDRFTVQIPADFQELKITSPENAVVWREYFRNVCVSHFAIGFQVIDYHSFNRKINYYEFAKIPVNTDN
ncbi:MAG: GNAT family N-acetyltransferase [Candidatus Heimdallarchaeota archaeon]|nr:GNAT family N-acetyltransferase [Candidatus Heimdallarchaeota archaeon]